MKRLVIASALLAITAAALAGPFDSVFKSAAPAAPAGTAKWVEPASKVMDTISLDSPEVQRHIGQSVALAATARYNGLDERDAIQAYVTFVGLTVAKAADPKESHGHYCFAVLNSDDATACSGPKGYVMITRGALNMMDDESELAGVLAHEIAHVYKNHGIDALRNSKLMDAGASFAGAADKHAAAFNSLSDNLATTLLEKGYSRGQELEADKLAIQFVARAGYDPTGYVRFLKKLELAKSSGGNVIFSTHPSTKDRVKTVEKLAASGGATNADRFRKWTGRG